MRSREGVSVTVQVSTGQYTAVDGKSRSELVVHTSDVEEADVLGVAGDEAAAGLDVLTHEDAEQLVGSRGVVEGDLEQDPGLRVHRGLPQLGRVHLAEALEALDRVVLDLAAGGGAGLEDGFLLLVGVDVLVTDL